MRPKAIGKCLRRNRQSATGNLLLPTSYFRLRNGQMPAAQFAIAHNGTHQKSNIKNQTSKIAYCKLPIAKTPIAKTPAPP
jgi:hypothetical protein